MEKSYKILKLVAFALLFALLMVGAYVLYNNFSSQMELPEPATEASAAGETETPKTAAPDFTVYDAEGNPVKLSDFQGKPVLLNFWASWCGPCKMEMPEFQDFFDMYGDQVYFVIVNLTDGTRETVESASGYIAQEGYTFPVYYDTAMEGAYAYGVNAVPVSYFIDAEGNLQAWAQGALSAEMLQQGMDILLG